MTVSTNESFVVYVASGSQDEFTFDFVFNETSDIKVYLDGSFLQETGFSVTANQDNQGGTVKLVVTPVADTNVRIVRETPYTQEMDYPPYGPFPAESHEGALDKLTMLVQQARDGIEEILATGFVNTGEWEPNTAYKTMNVTIYGGDYYTAKENFVSGQTFDPTNWNLVLDFSSVYDLAAQAAQSEANARESELNAKESETNAAVSEQNAAQSEASSAVSENNAANCSAAALGYADRAEAAADEAENTVSSGIRTDAIAQDYFTATDGQTTFTLSEPVAADNAVAIWMNSRKLRLTEDYTISGQNLVLNAGAAAGDEIDVMNFNLSILVVP